MELQQLFQYWSRTDNVVKVTWKICTQYLQLIWVGARATDLQGSIVDNLWRYADGVKSAHKGT